MISSTVREVSGQIFTAGRRTDFDRSGGGGFHGSPQGVGAVVMEVQPGTPGVRRIARDHGVSVQIGVTQGTHFVNIIHFRIGQFTENPVIPEFFVLSSSAGTTLKL